MGNCWSSSIPMRSASPLSARNRSASALPVHGRASGVATAATLARSRGAEPGTGEPRAGTAPCDHSSPGLAATAAVLPSPGLAATAGGTPQPRVGGIMPGDRLSDDAPLPTRVDRSDEEFVANRNWMLERLDEFEQLLAEARRRGARSTSLVTALGQAAGAGADRVAARPGLTLPRAVHVGSLGLGQAARRQRGHRDRGDLRRGMRDLRPRSDQPGGIVESLLAGQVAARPGHRDGEPAPYLVNLVESGGADLPDQAEVFITGGKWFRNLTQLSKKGSRRSPSSSAAPRRAERMSPPCATTR